MGKETKIVFFQIIEGNEEEVKSFLTALNNLKDKLPFDVEFLVGNDRIQLVDTKYLLNELYRLYKMEKRLREVKKEEVAK